MAPAKGIRIVATERYNPSDPSITAQVLKIVAANPDAVYILAAGTPGALPQIELARARLQGPRLPDAGRRQQRLPARRRQGPRRRLHDGRAGARRRAAARERIRSRRRRSTSSSGSRRSTAPDSRSLFAATAWDALLIAQQASREALKKAKPGTPEFRTALRDAIEGLRDFVGSEGVYNMSPTDHNGVDARSQVMVKIENGGWKLQP